MSNSTANVKVVLTYPQGGGTVTPPAISIDAPFQALNVATIDVPDAETSVTTHAVPFGAVDKATAVLIKNRTGQMLDVKINAAAAASHQLRDGGCMVIAAAGLPSDDLAAIDLITTGIQSGAGYIDCWVFGDSV